MNVIDQAPVRRRDGRRRTKIVATIGPASEDPTILTALAAAGMNVARVTLAHGTTDEAVARIRRVRAALPGVGIMADLPGPKIRAAPFPEGGAVLLDGSRVTLATADGTDRSDASRIAVASPVVLPVLAPGDRVALGDGGLSLVVLERVSDAGDGDSVVAEVRGGGLVRGRPGVSIPGRRFGLRTPSPEDLERLVVLLEVQVDAVAVSFVQTGADVQEVRSACGSEPVMLVAKIETPSAVDDLDRILEVSDGVMVARGDLGVRMPLEDVPHIQKRIIRSGVHFGRPVITATQMLESMVTAAAPTRAEVTDVANAVLDGTSALMLSAETAVGADPVAAVATMARIAERAERDFDHAGWGAALGAQRVVGGRDSPAAITAATTAAGWRAAAEEEAAVIVACTRSGTTARGISRFRPEMPIVAVTPSTRTARQLTLSWGVDALIVDESDHTDDIVWFAVQAAVRGGYARPGDVAVVLAGSPTEPEPATDTLRLVRVR